MTDRSSQPQTRINARLDATLAAKIERLRARTGMTITEVVRAALERYYEALVERAGDPKQLLEASGFVGCAAADEDLSNEYKSILAEMLEARSE